jgi:hypothetical protein
MPVETYEIVELPRREVLRFMGYRGQEITPEIDTRIDEGIARMLELAKPRASWGIFNFAQPDDSGAIRLIGSSLVLPGSSIARHLDGAVSCYVLAATVGMDVDRELKRLSATDPVAEVILDACGTVAVEQTAAACQKSIAKNAELGGFHANARFSPGYGDLPLSVQPALLATVNAQRYLGITLTKSLLMIPTKSITAIMGEFPDSSRARRAERASGSLE